MDSVPAEKCPEREKLLGEWAWCGRRLAKLLDEQLAAVKRSVRDTAVFEEQIRLARAAETEACRKYFGHVNTHGCEGGGAFRSRRAIG